MLPAGKGVFGCGLSPLSSSAPKDPAPIPTQELPPAPASRCHLSHRGRLRPLCSGVQGLLLALTQTKGDARFNVQLATGLIARLINHWNDLPGKMEICHQLGSFMG